MTLQTGWRWVGVPALELRDSAGRLRQLLTANDAPRRFALVAMTAAAPDCRVSRTEIRRRLFSDVGTDAVRQTIRRAQTAGWVRVDGEDVVLHYPPVPSTEPLRFVDDLLASTPGEFLSTDGWAEGLPAEFTTWWEAWRTGQRDLVVTALIAVVDAKWSAEARSDAWAGLRHLERWAPEQPSVRALQARMHRAVHTTPRIGHFEWPLIPRPELEDPLIRHLTEAQSPGVTAAFIQGEAGAGKSSLLQAIIHMVSAAQPGVQVVRVSGDWVPSDAAESAWMQTATRQRLVDAILTIPGVSESMDGQWLRNAVAGVHPAPVLRDRLAWIEAVRGAWRVALAGSTAGVLLALDDVQWIDQETQQLLTALLTMRTDRPWQMVAASRNERPGIWMELAQRAPERWTDVRLSGLSSSAIAIVALQTQAPPSMVADAFRYAAGHPFRWRELLRRAMAHGQVPDTDTLTDIFTHELASWSTAEMRLAFTILLLGEFATWELIARTLDAPPGEAEAAARPLRLRGILEPAVHQPSVRVWIAADRWRDAILQAADPDLRRDLHRRVGMVLDGAILLRERLDVQLRVLEHERQGGALEAAVARMPAVAARASTTGQATHALALWTTVLRDVHAAFGGIPVEVRRQWAEYAILHQIHPEALPLSSRDALTPEEQILNGFHSSPADGAEIHERNLDLMIALASRENVSREVRALGIQGGMLANESLPASRARRRRQRLLAQLAQDPRRDELPTSVRLWFAYFTRDWELLQQLVPHDPTTIPDYDVLAVMTTLRILGMNRHAWIVGAAALARVHTPPYVRWGISAMMIGTADAVGDVEVLQVASPILDYMREQMVDVALPTDMRQVGKQSVLLSVANGAIPWNALVDQEVAETWRDLCNSRVVTNSHRMAAQGLAMFLLAKNGRLDDARAWMARFQRTVSWRDVFMVSEDGASNFAWRILLTAALLGDLDLLERLRHYLRFYPELRAWVMREPTHIPRTLAAFFGCPLHELWGAEKLRPVRSIEEAMHIARAGAYRLPQLPPLSR